MAGIIAQRCGRLCDAAIPQNAGQQECDRTTSAAAPARVPLSYQAKREYWPDIHRATATAAGADTTFPLRQGRRAGDLRGRLLIIHGTSDLNAPFGGTIRMIDALERANKPYDLVLLPEMDHTGQNSPYSLQSIRRYLAEHLGLGQ